MPTLRGATLFAPTTTLPSEAFAKESRSSVLEVSNGSLDGTVRKLDRQGIVLMTKLLDAPIEAPPAIVRNLVYWVTTAGTVIALERSTWRVVWEYRTKHKVASALAIDRRRIIAATMDGLLTCLTWG